mmetsp:Transcript_11668/g.20709  ORF Transcript_11668/g.20709 Transcript_11668/m.20709 type:complete len:231 (-) Transcript_11668:434-1126(-)
MAICDWIRCRASVAGVGANPDVPGAGVAPWKNPGVRPGCIVLGVAPTPMGVSSHRERPFLPPAVSSPGVSAPHAGVLCPVGVDSSQRLRREGVAPAAAAPGVASQRVPPPGPSPPPSAPHEGVAPPQAGVAPPAAPAPGVASHREPRAGVASAMSHSEAGLAGSASWESQRRLRLPSPPAAAVAVAVGAAAAPAMPAAWAASSSLRFFSSMLRMVFSVSRCSCCSRMMSA